MLPEAFTSWIYPKLQNDWWGIIVPSQQDWLAINGSMFAQFLPSHSDNNTPTYGTGMPSFNSGMKVPNNLNGRPTDVDVSWGSAFPSLVGNLREAQYRVDVYETPTSIAFACVTRVYYDSVLWQITPTLNLLKENIGLFVAIEQTKDIVYIASVSALCTITGNEWREVTSS